MRFAALALVVSCLLGACQSFAVTRDLGARCDQNADCNQRCLTADLGWPGGMCTLGCDSDANCPNNAACIVDQGGVCAFRCSVDADCAFLNGGYTCMPIDRHSPDTGQTVMVCHG
jgi:hypothetical protein